MPAKDQRLEKRFALSTPVEVKVQSCPGHQDLEGTRFPGTTSDVSMNGIRLHLDRVLPVNTFMEMEVTLAEHVFLLSGTVVWSKLVDKTNAHVGVLFTTADESRMWSWKNQLSRILTAKQ